MGFLLSPRVTTMARGGNRARWVGCEWRIKGEAEAHSNATLLVEVWTRAHCSLIRIDGAGL